MAKLKVKRKSTLIDMTAMSDVTVLLLTFFMLTSTFVKKEPVQVNTPASVSEIKIPETNVLQVLVEPSGKVFLSLDKQPDRIAVLARMQEEYGVQLQPAQQRAFELAQTFGVPIKQMPAFYSLKSAEQDKLLKDFGVPIDTLEVNEFKRWVTAARKANPDLKIAIKADATTPYDKIKLVMNNLQDIKENRYNLLTSLKEGSAE